MKRLAWIVLLILIAGGVNAQNCTITGTITDGDGEAWANKPVTVKRVESQSGELISSQAYSRWTNSSGAVTLKIRKNSIAYIYADCWGMRGDNQEGIKVVVPNSSTASLSTLKGGLTIISLGDSLKADGGYATPTMVYAQASGVTLGVLSDSLDANTARSALSIGVLSDSLDANAVRAETDPVYVAGIASYSTTAAMSDSLDTVVRTEADPVYVAGIASYSTTAAISDSLDAVVRTEADPVYVAGIASYSTTAAMSDSLETVVRTESDPVYVAGIASYSTTTAISDSLDTVVRAEVDPTATAKAQAVVTDSLDVQQARAISSTSRMYVSDDSVDAFTGSINIDASTGNIFRGTTTGNTTATITNMVDGQCITVIVTQGASHTFTFANVSWAGGTAPTFTTGANAIDVFTIIQAGSIKYGSAVQDMQ